ncbi:hypothetical protein VaNZ11_001562 [Volvox africanus]|uniref:Uncharacterized protein n=1 Tax=Volvox africanus TaxID=51714 RepID=A0ABQ5RPY8_9CHLO|nr:hypothetical protein VaNZ11_001562 [Volvox africanus]
MTIELYGAVLRDAGRLPSLLLASPNATRLILNLSRGAFLVNADSSHNMAKSEDGLLVAGALDALAALRRPITSLTVLHLSCPLTLPSASTLAYLASCGLTELELQDISIQRAASDGASNLLRSPPPSMPDQLPAESLADSIRSRGTAMVRFACSLPSLRRLSLCNAAFSASDVSALAGLTQLEELSLIGAMKCGGPGGSPSSGPSQSQLPKLVDAMAAVPTYKHLLAALPRLRRLRLPMPIASSSCTYGGNTTGSGWDSDDCEDDIDDTIDGLDDDCGSFLSTNGFLSDGCSCAFTDALSNSSGFFAVSTLLDPGAMCQLDRSPLSSFELQNLGASPIHALDCSVGNISNGNIPLRDVPEASGGFLYKMLSWPSSVSRSRSSLCVYGQPAPTPVEAMAPVASLCPAGPVFGDWCFPPHLEELTIPLCFLNGPAFRAACEAYGSGGDGSHDSGAGVEGAAHRRLRALHVICAPGYTVWEGSFLNGYPDFAAMARLASSLESLHLALELGGSGRNALHKDRLRDCLRHLQALHKLQDLRIEETRQPVCFSVNRMSQHVGGGLSQSRALLNDLLGINGYGTRLPNSSGSREAEKRKPLALPLMPHLGPERTTPLPTFPLPRLPTSQRLPTPPHVPSNDYFFPLPSTPSFSHAPIVTPYAGVSKSASAPDPGLHFCDNTSAPCFDSLLLHWPHLRTLSVCGQCAIRSTCDGQTRLVPLSSLKDMSVLIGFQSCGL